MGLWPLFFTSFVVDDFLGDAEFRGARQVVLSSASSKTAIALAFLLSRRPGIDVVGLTSASNAEFVAGLGCYSSTVRYGDEATIATAPSVFVDFAGNADVRNAVHEHLGADLTYSMVVGGTHWDHTAATNAAPVGPRPEFFFAPTQIAKRTKEWGQAGLDDRMAVAWTDFATWTNEWVHHVRPRGAAEVQAAFAALVRGVIDPSATIVATMAS